MQQSEKEIILNKMNTCFCLSLTLSLFPSIECMNGSYKLTSLSQITARDHVLFIYCILDSFIFVLFIFYRFYARIVKTNQYAFCLFYQWHIYSKLEVGTFQNHRCNLSLYIVDLESEQQMQRNQISFCRNDLSKQCSTSY